MRLGSWRVALRIARRDALRAKGRSALVLAMIALPVLGVAGVDVVYHSSELTPAQRATRELGTADVLLEFDEPGARIIQAPLASDGQDVVPLLDGQAGTPEQQRSRNTDPAVLAARLLPPGSALVPIPADRAELATSATGRLRATVAAADLADPVWRGRIDLVSGRAPAGDRELAATRTFLDRSGLKVGSTTSLGDRSFTITGVAEYPDDLKTTALVSRPSAVAAVAAADTAGSGGSDPQAADSVHEWLVKLPAGTAVDWPKVLELNKYGFSATSRSVVLHPPARSQVPYYGRPDQDPSLTAGLDRADQVTLITVVGMALLEIVLLAGPAFAVGARRSRRQLGLLAAAGGDRAQVRAVVLGGGVVLGLAGAVVGTGLAVLLVVLARNQLELLSGKRFGALALVPGDLLGVAAIGLVTGLLAAVVPAVQAARQDVVAALTGRGTVRPPAKRLLALGVLMVGGGTAMALLGPTALDRGHSSIAVLGGSVIAELGMVACTPTLVGLFGRLGRVLPLAPRLALRDSVRHRGRTAPAVAAVMAAVAGSVAVGVYAASNDAEQRAAYVPSAPDKAVTLFLTDSGHGQGTAAAQRTAVERAMPDLGPGATVLALRYGDCGTGGRCGDVTAEPPPAARCPADDLSAKNQPVPMGLYQDPRCQRTGPAGLGSVVSGDPGVLHNLFGLPGQAAEQAAAAGKAVVFEPSMLQDGKAIVRLQEPFGLAGSPPPPYRDVLVDAVLAPVPHPAARMYLAPDTAARLGMGTRDSAVVWLPAAMPSDAAVQRATGALSELEPNGGDVLRVERGFRPRRPTLVLGLTAFAGLVALGAAGIATGLAAADSQQDLATLAAVGAAPGIRRRLSGFQCGTIAAMGALLGAVCGIVPAVALRRVMDAAPPGSTVPGRHTVIALPWSTLGLTLLVLPLLATGLAALLTRSRVTLVRRAA
ncbi:FtsX-like permease family protein [Kitasatospora sp. RB6PN24]|uniref:FtsX-like permease family protein n=1 Tax=Kitasatospora humi TaxID=2893891 RepID=UPI001E3E7CB6|nr:FtsX-like permease family protein [Kitasatospora humi]MCC9309678.1 FtsX-like permease family protein [Kitasatospora humi]